MGLGGSTSKKVTNIYASEPKVRAWQSRFALIRLSEKEIGQLYQVFLGIQNEDRKTVSTRTLAAFCKMEKYPFAYRVLTSFKKGQPFVGFVFGIWDICTTDERDLADFVFSLYNLTGEGISAEDAQTMLTELYGENVFKVGSKRRSEAMTYLYGSDKEATAVSRPQFKTFARKQSTALFLAFSIQRKIAESIVGKQFWESQSRKRSKMSDGELDIIRKLRAEILSGRMTVDDDGYDDDEDDEKLEEKSNPRILGKEKEKPTKTPKVVPMNEKPAAPIKLTVTAGGGAGSRRAGGLGVGSVGMPRERSSFDSATSAGTSSDKGAVTNNEEDKVKGEGFYRNRAQSLESDPSENTPTYLTEVRGVKSESALKAIMKKEEEKEGEGKKKKKKKKLVESDRMDKSALKAVLKAQMPADDEDDDKGPDVATGAAAIGIALTSQSEKQDKSGLLSLFSRVERKKKGKAMKEKVPEVLPPSILKTEEKKRRPSDKRVVFDLPDKADEDDYGYGELGGE